MKTKIWSIQNKKVPRDKAALKEDKCRGKSLHKKTNHCKSFK